MLRNNNELAEPLLEKLKNISPHLLNVFLKHYVEVKKQYPDLIDNDKLLIIIEVLASARVEEKDVKKLLFLSLDQLGKLKTNLPLFSERENFTELFLSFEILNIPLEQIRSLSPEALASCVNLTNELALPRKIDGYGIYKFPAELNYNNALIRAKNIPHYFLLLADPHFETNLHPNRLDFPMGIADHYIIRKSVWGQAYNMNQTEYGLRLHQGVLMGVYGLQENWSYEQLLFFLAFHRKLTADELGQVKTDMSFGYGVLRGSYPAFTPCDRDSVYYSLGQRLKSEQKEWKNSDNYIVKEEKNSILCTQREMIDGVYVNLSKVLIKGDDISILHTDPSEISKVMSHIEKLYYLALNETNEERLLEQLGEIYWWICQGKPWFGGDPSIAEMLIKTIWRFRTGKDLPPWKIDLVPWESVIEQANVKKYKLNFQNLLDFAYR